MAYAQTHVVRKAETVVRAIGVYEFTGNEARPSASRLVPVSIFINGQLQDAAIYMARPVPFALDTGTVFAVQRAGIDQGTLELAYQRHVEAAGGVPYDDGWQANGTYKPLPKEPVMAVAKKSGPLPQVIASGGTGPRLTNKSDNAPVSDSDGRHEVDRSSAAGAGTTVSADPAEKTRPDDKTGPTMRRRTADTDDSKADASDDAERPTLKKRSPAEMKAAQKKNERASVSSVGSLNDDPDRPVLHRGVADKTGTPALEGLPADMQQMVAVSDARDRPEHDFKRGWGGTERADVMARMEELARGLLAHEDAPKASAPLAAASVRGKKPPVAVAEPALVLLADETLEGYTLSYGGAATYVFGASAPAQNGAKRFVTLVAQEQPLGGLKIALSSVTDSNHLDRTPRMRLLDAVDADASNRASLLFELRNQSARQFALYRVIGAKADQIFLTGTTQ